MTSIQIKDVPPATHAVLRRRAALEGRSLQEYLRGRLIEEASMPTLDEVLESVSRRTGGSVTLRDAVEHLTDERARR